MERLAKARQVLISSDLDAILINSEENMHYFCGFSPSEGLVLIMRDAAYHLVDSRYTVAAKRYARESGLTVLEISAGFLDLVKDLLAKHSATRLGFEDEKLPVFTFKKWRDTLTADFVPLGKKISDLRNVKDEKELSYLTHAQQIAEKAYLELLNHIKPGKTEKQLAALLDYLMLQNGSDGASFRTILISGENTAMPHGVPSDKKIEQGDFITMDFGATYKGYHSDMTRTVAVEHCTDEMRLVYDTVLRAQLAAIDFLSAGKACKDVHQVAFDIIAEKGYGNFFKHGLGHGVGLEIHEGYRAAPSSNDTYQAGNVTSVEPGIYLPGQFGVRIEDVLYIGATGTVNLTKARKDLLILL